MKWKSQSINQTKPSEYIVSLNELGQIDTMLVPQDQFKNISVAVVTVAPISEFAGDAIIIRLISHLYSTYRVALVRPDFISYLHPPKLSEFDRRAQQPAV